MSDGFTPFGTEFLVNTETASNQNETSITALQNGGYVVTWVSNGQDGSSTGVHYQAYDASGGLLGTETQVNTYTNSSQSQPKITTLSDGDFLVTWSSFGQDGDGYGVFAQRFNSNGNPDGAEFQVNTYTANSQDHPDVTALEDGGFIMVWSSYLQDGDLGGVYAQRYNANGTLPGFVFRINSTTASSQFQPAITSMDDGGFMVIWSSYLQDGSLYGVFGQRYDVSSNPVGGEFQVNTYTADQQWEADVTTLSDGGFVVTWQSDVQDGSAWGTYARVYDASANPATDEFQVNTYTTSHQAFSAVAAMADGGFVVTWQSHGQDGAFYGIYAQRYDAAGDMVGDEVLINSHTADDQKEPAIAALENGGFVISWTSGDQDGDGEGVYAQQFAAELWGTSGADILEDTVGAGWIDGQNGGDELYGFGGKDTMFGGGGADTLSGGASKDLLYGQGGEDTLKGGKGNDELDGGIKDDKLTGGDGNDKFVFMEGSGMDKITDFEDDIDTFKLDEDLWGGGLTKQEVIDTYASVDGGDIVFDFGTDQLRLKGFTDLTELKDDMTLI